MPVLKMRDCPKCGRTIYEGEACRKTPGLNGKYVHEAPTYRAPARRIRKAS